MSLYDIDETAIEANPNTWSGDRAHLAFTIQYIADDYITNTSYENCLVCFNVKDDGILRKDDTGIGACWTWDGTPGNNGQNDDVTPSFNQMGTVVALDSQRFKQADTNGWEESFTWNALSGITDKYIVAVRHYSDTTTNAYSYGISYVEFVSKPKASIKDKDLGLHLGDNWIRCYVG